MIQSCIPISINFIVLRFFVFVTIDLAGVVREKMAEPEAHSDDEFVSFYQNGRHSQMQPGIIDDFDDRDYVCPLPAETTQKIVPYHLSSSPDDIEDDGVEAILAAFPAHKTPKTADHATNNEVTSKQSYGDELHLSRKCDIAKAANFFCN